MRLYRLNYVTTVHVLESMEGDTSGYTYVGKAEDHTEWFTSERQAVVRRLLLVRLGKIVGKKRDAKIWPVDVPVRKVALVAWLNEQQESGWK